jgi:hypothetical protein
MGTNFKLLQQPLGNLPYFHVSLLYPTSASSGVAVGDIYFAPLPPAVLLFGSGLLVLMGVRNRID